MPNAPLEWTWFSVVQRNGKTWLASFLFVFTCFLLPARAAQTVPENDKHVRLQLKWTHQFQFAGFYAAAEKGFYRDAGLDVQILEGRADMDFVQEVTSGRADYGLEIPDLLLRRSAGEPVVMLAAIFQHSPVGLLSLASSGIKTPQDLVGKRVMMGNHSTSAELKAMLLSEGIRLDEVQVLERSCNFDDLRHGRADAASVYVIDYARNQEFRGVPVNIMRPVSYGIDFYGDCLFTSARELKEHPQRVRAFRAASLRGWEYAMEHPEEIARLIYDKYSQRKSVEELLSEAAAMKPLLMSDVVAVGHINPGRWRHIANTYIKLGMLPSEASLDGFIYDPNPPPDNHLLKWAAIAAGGGLIVLGLLAAMLFLFNRRLEQVAQKRTAELERSESQFRTMIESAPEAIFVQSEGILLYLNLPMVRLLGGKRPEELLGTNAMERIALHCRERVRERIRRQRETGKPAPLAEFEFIRLDGSVFPVETTAVPIRYQDKESYLVFARDITLRKQAEEAILASEKQLKAIVDASPFGAHFYELQPDGRLLLTGVNAASNRMLKTDCTSLVGKTIEEAFPSLAATDIPHRYRQVAAVGGSFSEEVVNYDADEKIRGSFEIHAFQTGPNRMAVQFQDVTARKRTEAAMASRLSALTQPLDVASDINFEQLFELEVIQQLQDQFAAATGVASLITRPDGTPLTRPSNFCRLCSEIIRPTEKEATNCKYSDACLGRQHPEGPIIQPCLSGGLWDAGASITVGNKHIANWLIGQVRDETQNEDQIRKYAKSINVDEDLAAKAFREVPAMSKARFTQISQTLFNFANQLSTTAYQNLQQARFIHQLKQAEEELQRNEARYRLIVENLNDAFIIHDRYGRISDLNENAARMTGYTRGELLMGGLDLIETEESRAQKAARMAQVYELGVLIYDDYQVRKHGAQLAVNVSARLISKEGDGIIQSFVRDITAQRQLEEQLRQAQKMEAIGQLAGGVAHDFNNILAAMTLNLTMLQQNSALDQETREGLLELESGAKRAASLTRQLLMFSRRSALKVQMLNLNETVANLLKMLGRLVGDHITLVFEQGMEVPTVLADVGMLEQVLMNLVVNARDAMPKGGQITISISNARFSKAQLEGHPDRRAGKFACMSVRDTGSGMDETVVKRLFEPFFSTKDVGKGTGLGLATIYGIIAQHKGWIEVQSEVGKGSLFKVYLPASNQTAAASKPPQPDALRRGRETILLAEDDLAVRDSTAKALRQLGYQVLEAGDGPEAVHIYESMGGKLDLLLTDMVMPNGMSGLELAGKLRQSSPTLEVIVATGYSAEMADKGLAADQRIVCLQKPCHLAELSKAIRVCLDRG